MKIKQHTYLFFCTKIILLSLFYACCSQCCLFIPFTRVPLGIQPMPIFLATFYFGWTAVYAYGLYLFEGVLGAPIFAGMMGGMGRLLGPTGGYLIGFGIAAAFLTMVTKNNKKINVYTLWVKIQLAMVIVFIFGLLQLMFFAPPGKVLAWGLYPHIVGDFIINPLIMVAIMRSTRIYRKYLL